MSLFDENNGERHVSYYSRALKGAELNYSTLGKKRDFDIKFTLECHKYILLGYPGIVRTNRMLFNQLCKQSKLGARQLRWLNQISEYDVKEVKHI